MIKQARNAKAKVARMITANERGKMSVYKDTHDKNTKAIFIGCQLVFLIDFFFHAYEKETLIIS